MKRSEINQALKNMEEMIRKCGFHLPPFCDFTPDEWKEKGHEYDEIRDNMLGWDITDYGLGNFKKIGFSLITLRNGNTHMDKYKKTYAEKLLYLEEDQSATMHFHWTKMEDIINRGGGNVLIRVYNSKEDGSFDDTDVTIHSDGREYTVPAGTQIRLTPGESITVYPYMVCKSKTTSAILYLCINFFPLRVFPPLYLLIIFRRNTRTGIVAVLL